MNKSFVSRFVLCSVVLLLVFAFSIDAVEAQNRRGAITNMRCEYTEEPISIDQNRIRFT